MHSGALSYSKRFFELKLFYNSIFVETRRYVSDDATDPIYRLDRALVINKAHLIRYLVSIYEDAAVELEHFVEEIQVVVTSESQETEVVLRASNLRVWTKRLIRKNVNKIWSYKSEPFH